MDTDSFVLRINTQNIIQDLHKLKNYFDFSNLNEIINYLVMKTKKCLVNLK